MPHNLAPSEQLAYCTVRIECQLTNGNAAVGTAFQFNFRRRGTKFVPCLVTNGHVIDQAVTGRLRFHVADAAGSPIIGQTHQFEVLNFDQSWYRHPDPSIDLAILPVGDMMEQMGREGRSPFAIAIGDELVPTEADVSTLGALEEVVMVGYPIGISDVRNNLPVFRRGITASHPAIDYDGQPKFLIDAACFPGSSGSPVFLYNLGSYATKVGSMVVGSRVKLLGVLYAGPVHTAEGKLEVVNIPTSQRVVSTDIPTHLGFVLKTRLLKDFEPIIDAALAKSDA
jgi:hypothetical protein